MAVAVGTAEDEVWVGLEGLVLWKVNGIFFREKFLREYS